MSRLKNPAADFQTPGLKYGGIVLCFLTTHDAHQVPTCPRLTRWVHCLCISALFRHITKSSQAGVSDQLKVERDTYLATHQELEDFRVNIDQRLKLARDAVVVWGQAHRNLGMGIPVAPMIDIAGMASGLARTAVPLP